MSQINPYAATAAIEPPPLTSDPGRLELAGRWLRLLSAVIDVMVQFVVACPSVLGLGVIFAFSFNGTLASQFVLGMLGNFVGFLIFLALNAYPLATQGKTIGKLIVGIRIVDEQTGRVPSFGPLILRRYAWQWGVLIIPYLGGLLVLLDAALIFRESHKCFHDETSGTVVVIDQKGGQSVV